MLDDPVGSCSQKGVVSEGQLDVALVVLGPPTSPVEAGACQAPRIRLIRLASRQALVLVTNHHPWLSYIPRSAWYAHRFGVPESSVDVGKPG